MTNKKRIQAYTYNHMNKERKLLRLHLKKMRVVTTLSKGERSFFRAIQMDGSVRMGFTHLTSSSKKLCQASNRLHDFLIQSSQSFSTYLTLESHKFYCFLYE
jgi:hypothetical protein